jgi:hypothetical protein
MRRRYVIATVLAVAIAGFAYWYASSPRTGTRVQLPSSTPVAIDISVLGRPLATITNAEGLAAVMEMLRSGRSVRQHECKSRGTMELRFSDGQTLKMSFLPGHHFLHYEFAMGDGWFVVSRSRFMGALRAAGVDVHDIPTD